MPPLFCLSDCSIIQGGINPSPTVFFHIFLKPCQKAPQGIFDSLKKGEASLSLFLFTFLRWQSGG